MELNGTTRLALALIVLACACGGSSDTDRRPATQSPGSPTSPDNPYPVQNPGSAGAAAPIDNTANPAGSGAAQPNQPTPGNNSNNLCEVVHLVANPQVPDMMIVLDRSGSMQQGGRWQPSVSAVRRVTNELQARIRFGLALFPDPKATTDTSATLDQLAKCLTAPDPQMCLDQLTGNTADGACAPGVIAVPIAANNAAPIGSVLDKTQPGGGTPTSDTLHTLLDNFANVPAPDQEVHAKYVLLVTDGAPTCPAGMGSDTTQPDIDASNAAVEALLARDVKTYVIGYDTTGAGNESLAAVLDGLAQRGGTGDTKHHPVEDEASLLSTLQSITSAITSCSFQLDKAPARADFVLVRLDSKQVNLGDANGWKLVGDRTVELVGGACDQFHNGTHTLSAEVQCAVVAPN